MKSTSIGFKSVHEKISAIQRSTKPSQEEKDKAIFKLRKQQKTVAVKQKVNKTVVRTYEYD